MVLKSLLILLLLQIPFLTLAQNDFSVNYKLYYLSNIAGSELYKTSAVQTDILLKIKTFEENEEFTIKYTLKHKDGLTNDFLMEAADKDNNLSTLMFKSEKNKINMLTVDGEKKSIDFKNDFFVVEPPVISFLYPILKNGKKDVNLFIPSKGEIAKGELKDDGYCLKKINKQEVVLKKSLLLFGNDNIEIFTDKSNIIAVVNSKTTGYYVEISDFSLNSYEKTLLNDKYKNIKNNLTINYEQFDVDGFKTVIRTYILKNNNSNSKTVKNILLINDFGIPDESGHGFYSFSKNNFYDELTYYLTEKGFKVIRYSFENFTDINIKNLTFENKYKIIKSITDKFIKQNLSIIAIGEGSVFAYKLKKDLNTKLKKTVLLNPVYFSYDNILTKQTQDEILTESEKSNLTDKLNQLLKIINSTEEFITFNKQNMPVAYFKSLFKEKGENYSDILNENIAIFTSQYDIDIDKNNGWYLYSSIKTQNKQIKNVEYKEFSKLNHYFYEIPYKSLLFESINDKNINKDFLKNLYKFLKK